MAVGNSSIARGVTSFAGGLSSETGVSAQCAFSFGNHVKANGAA